jgi:hypothetical protein
MDAQSISTPQYFMDTYKVDAAQAETLSAQAKAVSVNRGGGFTTEPPPSVQTSATPAAAPGAVPLAAQAEYDQLMADRASGKINNAQWNSTGVKREQELAELIANGAGAQPAPLVPAAQSTAFDQHFAPPTSPSDYRTTHLETPTDETMAADLQLREAAHADRIPNSLFAAIDTDIAAAQRRQETPQQRDARIDAEDVRTKAMWGGNLDQNIAIIREAVDKVSERTRAAFNTAWPLLSPNSRDQVLQWAKYRTGSL